MEIYAVIGKLKLILSGFHEGVLQLEVALNMRPNEKYRFEFTTASSTIKTGWVLKNDRALLC